MTLLLALALAAAPQTTRSTDRLPHADPLPLAAADDQSAAVLATVDALFAGLAARDGAAILAQTRPEGGVLAAPAGGAPRRESWAEFAAGLKPGPERFAERLTDPAVEVDGDIAMVWSPYVFTVDGRVQHCGTDHFDLVREGGRWKVLNVTYSDRRTGC